jgi:hypothetical protein
MSELVLEYHVLYGLTVSDFLHGAVLAGVDVEPAQTQSVHRILMRSERFRDKDAPVGLVILGQEIALLDDAVLLREVGFGEGLS